jgi:hypothetical protein
MPQRLIRSFGTVLLLSLLAVPGIYAEEPSAGRIPAVGPPPSTILALHFSFASSSGGRLGEVATVREYSDNLWLLQYYIQTPAGEQLQATERTTVESGVVHTTTRFTDTATGYWVEVIEALDLGIDELSEMTPARIRAAMGTEKARGGVATQTQRLIRLSTEIPKEEQARPFDTPLGTVFAADAAPPEWKASLTFLATAVCPLTRRELSENLCQKVDAIARVLDTTRAPAERTTDSSTWTIASEEHEMGPPAATSATGRLLEGFRGDPEGSRGDDHD